MLLFPPTSLSAYFLAWSRDIQNKRKKKTSQAEYIYINIKIGNTILVIFILSVQTRATYILQIISSNLILQEEKKISKKELLTYKFYLLQELQGLAHKHMSSLLSIIKTVDSFQGPLQFYTLLDHTGTVELGYIAPHIAEYFKSEQLQLQLQLQHQQEFVIDLSQEKKTIQIASQYDTLEKRTKLFANVAQRWRTLISELEELLDKGWRNELYTVYNPTSIPYFYVERAFSVLIGVVSYGVHINGYIPPHLSSTGELKFWVPKRSMTKPTYPGMLDNTVAGGLEAGRGIKETVFKECFEEAGLKQEFVQDNLQNSGVVSYMYQPTDGRVQPEVEFIYDLTFKEEDAHLIQPQDGEAEDFQLMSWKQVITAIKNNKFKPNCALIIIDFLIRHGYITPENEPHYLEIVSRCHVQMPFPTIS